MFQLDIAVYDWLTHGGLVAYGFTTVILEVLFTSQTPFLSPVSIKMM